MDNETITNDTHDETFLGILRDEKNIAGFLDSLFGFLYRCTDFYVESSSPSTSGQSLGFPPGFTEQLVIGTLRKWKARACLSSVSSPTTTTVKKLTVTDPEHQHEKNDRRQLKKPKKIKDDRTISSECYNGASCDGYRWSQTINELDVVVPVTDVIRSSKDLRVNLETERLRVSVLQNGDWLTLVDGEFGHPVKSSESYWCLEPGRHVSLHLDKTMERWWDALLVGEKPIELSRIDCSRNIEDMAEREQMKIQELVWNQRQKQLGKPTTEQIKMEKILQKAWNADGSPFKGTEYDSSLVKFN